MIAGAYQPGLVNTAPPEGRKLSRFRRASESTPDSTPRRALAFDAALLMKIHVNRDGTEVGVFSPGELSRGLEKGEVKQTDLAWIEGKTNWMPVSELPEEFLKAATEPPALEPDAPKLPPAVYHPVPVARFVMCSVATFGIYTFYWFYRTWDFVRRRDRSQIWPFWRALFAPIWTFFLVRDVERTARVQTSQAAFVALLYAALNASGYVLPAPYAVLCFFTFFPLINTVRRIADLNRERLSEAGEPVFARRHVIICVLVPLGLLLNFAFAPEPAILLGEELSQEQLGYLRKAEIIEEGEKVLFLHRAGVFSIAEMGQLLTDRRVINYRLESPNKTAVESVAFADVKDVRAVRPENPKLQTKLEVITGERVYAFGLSRNENRDVAFEGELKRLVDETQASEGQ